MAIKCVVLQTPIRLQLRHKVSVSRITASIRRQSEEPSVTPAADCPSPRAHVLLHCGNRQTLLHTRKMASRWQAAQTTRAPALEALNAAVRGLLTLAAPHMKGGFTKVHFYGADSRGSSPSPSRPRVDRSVAMITRHPLAFRVSGTRLTS